MRVLAGQIEAYVDRLSSSLPTLRKPCASAAERIELYTNHSPMPSFMVMSL